MTSFDKIKKVVNPLKGRKISAYYGCMLLRPSTTMQFSDPKEIRQSLRNFIKALGATPVVYPMRNECCGGYISLKENGINAVNQIMVSASYKGAEELITACPLACTTCAITEQEGLPVTYFTELLAEALGIRGGAGMKICNIDEIRAIAGVDARKCMKCGKMFRILSCL